MNKIFTCYISFAISVFSSLTEASYIPVEPNHLINNLKKTNIEYFVLRFSSLKEDYKSATNDILKNNDSNITKDNIKDIYLKMLQIGGSSISDANSTEGNRSILVKHRTGNYCFVLLQDESYSNPEGLLSYYNTKNIEIQHIDSIRHEFLHCPTIRVASNLYGKKGFTIYKKKQLLNKWTSKFGNRCGKKLTNAYFTNVLETMADIGLLMSYVYWDEDKDWRSKAQKILKWRQTNNKNINQISHWTAPSLEKFISKKDSELIVYKKHYLKDPGIAVWVYLEKEGYGPSWFDERVSELNICT